MHTVIKSPATAPPGIDWYHPHHHMATADQVKGGLAGAIQCGDPLDPYPQYQGAIQRALLELSTNAIRRSSHRRIKPGDVRSRAPNFGLAPSPRPQMVPPTTSSRTPTGASRVDLEEIRQWRVLPDPDAAARADGDLEHRRVPAQWDLQPRPDRCQRAESLVRHDPRL